MQCFVSFVWALEALTIALRQPATFAAWQIARFFHSVLLALRADTGQLPRSAQRTKASAQLLCEECPLFERGEMTTPIEFMPIDKVGIEAFGPAAGCTKDLVRKNTAAYGKIDDAEIGRSRVLEVHPRR